jgi:hypothetical protein
MAIDNDLLLSRATDTPTDNTDTSVVRSAIHIIEDSKLVMNDYLNDLDNI